MDQDLGLRIVNLYQDFNKTEICRELLMRYREQDATLLRAMETMTEEQRNAVSDYLGVYFAMYDRLMEYVCARI